MGLFGDLWKPVLLVTVAAKEGKEAFPTELPSVGNAGLNSRWFCLLFVGISFTIMYEEL